MIAYGRESIEKAKLENPLLSSSELSDIASRAAADMQRTIENNITLAKKHGITDPVQLEKITQDAADTLRKPIGEVRGMYSRTKTELDELAFDPAKGKITDESIIERDAGLSCEADGQIAGPITRSLDPEADFIDVNGKAWDVKSFRTDWQNGYDFNTAMSAISKEIAKGQNVILNTTYLAKWAEDELIAGIKANNWLQYVRFYP